MRSDVLILVAGRAVQALLTIAAFRLLTAFLSPAEVGAFYLMMSMAALFGMFLLGPVGMYLNRKLFTWYDQKTVFAHFLGFNVFALIVSAVAFVVVLLLRMVFGLGADIPGVMFALVVACYVYVLNWNQNIFPALNTFGHKGVFVSFTIVTIGLGLILSIAFVKAFEPRAIEWISGQVVAMGAVTIIGAYIFRALVPEGKHRFLGVGRYIKKATIAAVAAFSLPLAGAAFFMWAQGQSYRVILERAQGAEFLAYMAVGFSIATSVAGIMESLAQQIYLPEYYRRISAGDKPARLKALMDLAEKTIPVYVIYLFFVAGTAEFLVYFLVDPKFKEVFVFARYAAFIEFFRMSTNILASAAHSEMRTGSLIVPYLAGGSSAVLLTIAAAYSPSPEVYVPLALLSSGLVTLFVMRRTVKKLFGEGIPARGFFVAALPSIGFILVVFVHPRSPVQAVAVMALSGVYFVLLQYAVSRKWISGKKSGSADRAGQIEADVLASGGREML